MKLLTLAIVITSSLLTSCSGYEQNIQGMKGKKFCLDLAETKKRNNIYIGNGYLSLNGDLTFTVTNDSSKFSNIKGTWDLCCNGSDWGNYIFKPNNHIRQMSSLPEFEIKIDDQTYSLVFTNCH